MNNSLVTYMEQYEQTNVQTNIEFLGWTIILPLLNYMIIRNILVQTMLAPNLLLHDN